MKKIAFLTLLLGVLLSFSACKKDRTSLREINNHKFASSINNEVKAIQKKNDDELDSYISRMSLEEKVSQMFIINLEGDSVFTPVDKLDGNPYVPGGYLFFSYNLAETTEKVRAFTDSIASYCNERNIIPPFLAVDEEGGYVQRLRKLAGKIPGQEDVAKTMSVSEAYRMYSEHAVKMKEMGFHMNLSPVVEVLSDYNKDFLDGRSFGNSFNTTYYSIAEMNGYQNKGIACVLKHFPGNTNTDPHTGLPEITLSMEELDKSLEPFTRVLSLGPKAVLMSHARTSVIDSDVPACFSKTWVTEKLRNKNGFEGIIFSDDIFMGALAQNGYPPETACVKAVEAGIDCIMISEKRFLKPAMVLVEKARNDVSFATRIDESVRRILKYKIEEGIFSIKLEN
ncbi:MAG: glycoside hydrolase family 3 protein [Treponema sp.]|nr:glycoside hydrolase family 3 protein [Treponema sp.]